MPELRQRRVVLQRAAGLQLAPAHGVLVAVRSGQDQISSVSPTLSLARLRGPA